MSKNIILIFFLFLSLFPYSPVFSMKLKIPQKINLIRDVKQLTAVIEKMTLGKKIQSNKKIVPITNENLTDIVGNLGIKLNNSPVTKDILAGIIFVKLHQIDPNKILLKNNRIIKLLQNKIYTQYETLFTIYYSNDSEIKYFFDSQLFPEFRKLLKKQTLLTQLLC